MQAMFLQITLLPYTQYVLIQDEKLAQVTQRHGDELASLEASLTTTTATATQALEMATVTQFKLDELRPSFDDATNAWNASM